MSDVVVYKREDEPIAIPPLTMRDGPHVMDLTGVRRMSLTMNGVDRIWWWVDRSAGVVGTQPVPDAVGVYKHEFEIEWDDGMHQTIPNTGPMSIEVQRQRVL